MLRRQQVSITQGLVLSFCVLVSIFLSFGLYSLYDLGTISRLTRTIYNHPLAVSNAALQANISVTKMHRHMKDVVLFDSPIRILKSIEAIQEQEKAVYGYLDVVKERILGDKGQQLEEEARTLFEQWQPIREEIVEMVRNNQRQAAANITIGKDADHVAALEAKMMGLAQYARNKASQFMAEADKRRSRTSITTLMFLIASVLAAALTIAFTLKHTASAETALKESQQLLTSAIDRAPIGMVMVEPGGKFLKANRAFCDMTGYAEDELEDMHFRELTHPEDQHMGSDIFQKLIDGSGSRASFEKRFIRKEGQTIHVLLSTSLLRDNRKRPQFFFTQAQDITERKLAKERLQESLERYRIVSEFTHDWEYWLGPDGQVIFISPSCERITGYPTEAFVEDPHLFASIAHADDLEKVRAHYLTHQRDPQEAQLDFRIVRKDGQIRWINHICLPVFADDGAFLGIRASNRDITDRKQGEDQLRASEQRFRELFDNMSAGVAIYDSPDDGESFIFRDFNRSGLRHGNKIKSDIIGKEVRDVFPGIEATGLFDVFREVWRTAEPKRHPTTMYKDQEMVLWVENYVCKLPSGELVAIYEDTTEKKNAEIERAQLEQQLFQSQKLESVGTLAGGIAHDFNNILASIIGFTELALDDAEKASPMERNLMEVYIAGKRARDLVKQILAFARQSDEARKPVQVSSLAKEALKLIRSTTPTSIEIEQQIVSTAMVMANPTQIHQIFMNLCTNAVQAIKDEEGRVTIALTDVRLNETRVGPLKGLKPGDYLALTVSDTGMGIRPDIQASIFEPYFTTKGAGEGTGMGLAMVHGIVESYGGKITFKSEPDQGTEFCVYLPSTHQQEGQQSNREEVLPAGKERVLIVDDELAVAEMSSRLLKHLGYDTTFRTSSVDALELFRRYPDEFDLVISDMTMPNMTGDKLAAAMLKIRPDLPVIICTGYSRKISEEIAIQMGIKGFALKPLVKADLAKLVRRVLDEVQSTEVTV